MVFLLQLGRVFGVIKLKLGLAWTALVQRLCLPLVAVFLRRILRLELLLSMILCRLGWIGLLGMSFRKGIRILCLQGLVWQELMSLSVLLVGWLLRLLLLLCVLLILSFGKPLLQVPRCLKGVSLLAALLMRSRLMLLLLLLTQRAAVDVELQVELSP